MKKSQLNILAVTAKQGCEMSLWKLKRYFAPFIQDILNRSWYLLDDYARFEDECYRYVEDSIKRYDPEKGDLENMVNYRLMLAEKKYVGRGSHKRLESLDAMPYTVRAQIEDDTIDVAGDVVTKETAALLAKGDQRRMAILNAWLDGLNNDSQLSSLLAQRLGGKRESHRKFITRFRYECKEALRTYVC